MKLIQTDKEIRDSERRASSRQTISKQQELRTSSRDPYRQISCTNPIIISTSNIVVETWMITAISWLRQAQVEAMVWALLTGARWVLCLCRTIAIWLLDSWLKGRLSKASISHSNNARAGTKMTGNISSKSERALPEDSTPTRARPLSASSSIETATQIRYTSTTKAVAYHQEKRTTASSISISITSNRARYLETNRTCQMLTFRINPKNKCKVTQINKQQTKKSQWTKNKLSKKSSISWTKWWIMVKTNQTIIHSWINNRCQLNKILALSNRTLFNLTFSTL